MENAAACPPNGHKSGPRILARPGRECEVRRIAMADMLRCPIASRLCQRCRVIRAGRQARRAEGRSARYPGSQSPQHQNRRCSALAHRAVMAERALRRGKKQYRPLDSHEQVLSSVDEQRVLRRPAYSHHDMNPKTAIVGYRQKTTTHIHFASETLTTR